MAIAAGNYPCTRDRVRHIALLCGRYITLLVAIRVSEKIMVCVFSFINSERFLTNYAECSKRSTGSDDNGGRYY